MRYLTMDVDEEIGEPLTFWLPDRTKKEFHYLEEALEYFAAQGWEFLSFLPLEWRRLQEAADPAAPLETKGLRLSQYRLLFRERQEAD